MSPENDVAGGMNYRETELSLGMPGNSRQKCGAKRGFSETVGLSLGSSSVGDESEDKNFKKNELLMDNELISQAAAKSPKAKNQIVGWPPVRPFRQNMMMKPNKFVKIAVDGAPYLRKVDLETYQSYQQLLCALGNMFTCFTIRDGKVVDPVNGSEFVATYEDKDGDWMLVGDVPWKMFVESCKRVRLMKSSEAIGLAPKTPPHCSSSSS